jgi:ketopantoate hydroxymethyltransferase
MSKVPRFAKAYYALSTTHSKAIEAKLEGVKKRNYLAYTRKWKKRL